MSEKTLCNQILVRNGGTAIIIIKGAIKKPVTKMKPFVPKIIAAISFHKAHPGFHAFVLIVQYFSITIRQVHIPWYNGSCIRPTGRAPGTFPQYIRDDKRHTAIDLVGRYIFQPFCKEIV